ncbi:uncharacterized protein WCC33_009803 [Rhinophrynus dorsalis]
MLAFIVDKRLRNQSNFFILNLAISDFLLAKNAALSKDKKIAKSLAIIVCTFCICWAPYSFLTIIREGFSVSPVGPGFTSDSHCSAINGKLFCLVQSS